MNQQKEIYKISVVTPSYNQGRFIEDAIISVLNQDYTNFEHIIIDNCSTDKTIDILLKYPHLIWISEPDNGQSDALNKGFKIADGEIIGWLNSDDFFLSNTFKTIVKYFKYKEAHYVYGDFYLIDEYGKALRLVRPIKYDFNIILHYGPYIPSSGSFFDKKLIEENLLLDIKHRFNMDRKFFLELGLAKKRFVYVKEQPLSCFRVHSNNISKPSISKKNKIVRSSRQNVESEKVYYSFSKRYSDNKILEKLIRLLLRYFYRIKFILLRFKEFKFSKDLKNKNIIIKIKKG